MMSRVLTAVGGTHLDTILMQEDFIAGEKLKNWRCSIRNRMCVDGGGGAPLGDSTVVVRNGVNTELSFMTGERMLNGCCSRKRLFAALVAFLIRRLVTGDRQQCRSIAPLWACVRSVTVQQ